MTATPNHALQRTAPRVTARAFCERSGSYIWASGVRATVGHAPRHAPQSLSLGSLGHMQRALSFVAILPVTLLMGCAYALPVASRQTDVKLRVQTSHPEHHAVRVAAIEPPSDYRVPSDGRVAFTVPSFRHGCSVYLFGAIKIADGTPEHLRVIEVRRDERVLRRFSLTQLTSLPEDETGYRIVRVGD